MEVSLLSSSRNYKCLTQKIRNMSYLLKNTLSRVKRHFSERFARKSFPVPQACDLLSVILFGGHLQRRYIPAQTVRYKFCTHRVPLMFYLLAPNTQTYTDYDGPLRHDAGAPEVVPMTRLQVLMSREIGGWPLYTIVIGLGQVCRSTSPLCTMPLSHP